MTLRLVFLLAGLVGSSLAGEVTLRVEFPDKIVLPKPQVTEADGVSYGTALHLRFVIENHTASGVQITTLVSSEGGPRMLYPVITARLTGPSGTEIPGGFAAAESFAGSAALKETLLPAGKSISLPYYRGTPFEQITVAGTYTLKVSASFRDEKGVSHACEAKSVTFLVEFEK